MNSIDPRHQDHIVFTCAEVYPRIWQGSRPYPEETRSFAPWDVYVFCDGGWQPNLPSAYHAPFNDDEAGGMNLGEEEIALDAASHIAEAWRANKRILTTCHAGHNRSGFVNALAMTMIAGMSGTRAAQMVRLARPGSLYNTHFVKRLDMIRQGRGTV